MSHYRRLRYHQFHLCRQHLRLGQPCHLGHRLRQLDLRGRQRRQRPMRRLHRRSRYLQNRRRLRRRRCYCHCRLRYLQRLLRQRCLQVLLHLYLQLCQLVHSQPSYKQGDQLVGFR